MNWDDSATNDAGPNQYQISLFICPSAPPNRVGSNKRGILDYPAINEIDRTNTHGTGAGTLYPNGYPKSDSTFIGVMPGPRPAQVSSTALFMSSSRVVGS